MGRKRLSILAALILLIALPLFLIVIKQTQDNRSSAAAPDQLEAEGGVLSGNAQLRTDSLASGGQYVLFASQTPTNTPTPTPSQTNSTSIGLQPVVSTPLSQGNKFVSPTGTGTSCTQASPCSLPQATNAAVAGDVVFLRGGTYPITANIYFRGNGQASKYITFESYPGEWAVLDGSSLATGTQIYIRIAGSYNRLRRMEIKNMPYQGLHISGNRNIVDGLVVHHNKLSGIQVYSPYEAFPYGQYGSYNTIQNVEIYDNSDANLGGAGQEYNRGGNADGISISSGEGNVIKNVLSRHNSDDGIDVWRSTNSKISYSISTGNGIDQGNGDGFKAGGASPSNGTMVDHSIAYSNKSVGFDTNSGLNVTFDKVTSWNNAGHGFYTYSTTKTLNSISAQNNPNYGGSGTVTNNSWQRTGTVSFVSTDPTSSNFLKPTAGGGFTDIGAYAN